MAPWCNRLSAGPMRFGSRQLDLPSNFPDGTAIHGQVFADAWAVRDDGSLAIRRGGGGWPWRYQVTQRLTLQAASARLELMLLNEDDAPMPAGLGLHPWFLKPDAVAIHATQVFPDNLRSDPQPQRVTGRFDLRTPRHMPANLDATWAGLAQPAVELLWPGLRARMRIEGAAAFVVAASPPSVGAVAIEAETHAPQGLRRLINGEPGAMALLAPGQTLSLTLLMDFEVLPPAA